MASSSGIDARTGQVLLGWEHTKQSMADILTTPIGTRVMRRDYGSEIPELVDRPMTAGNILGVYAAAANALYPRQVGKVWYGEPRFRLRQCELVEASEQGALHLNIGGDYVPRGHLGDETVEASNVSFSVALR